MNYQMSSLHDPKNVLGLTDLLLTDKDEMDIDPKSIEESIMMGNISNPMQSQNQNYANLFNTEMERLMQELQTKNITQMSNDLTNELDNALGIGQKHVSFNDGMSSGMNGMGGMNNFNMNSGMSSGMSSGMNGGMNSNSRSTRQSVMKPQNMNQGMNDMVFDIAGGSGDDDLGISIDADSDDDIQDIQLNNMTKEERKQKQINRILGTIKKKDETDIFMEQQEEEDEMTRMLEQIDQLRVGLETDGVDLANVPSVSLQSSKQDIKSTLKMLRLKNNRLRYGDIFNEGILAVAYMLESTFDGKKEYFGRKPDLVGWPETVKVKLKRMKYDTSEFVSDIMKDYQISSGWRILLELVPSLFLYSRDRRVKADDNLINEDQFKAAMSNLNGM